MAGHSHWAGIKHKKGRADKQRSKIFSKISKEIDIEVIAEETVQYLKKGLRKNSSGNFSQEPDPRFDLVYLDPPYSSNLYLSVLESLISEE